MKTVVVLALCLSGLFFAAPESWTSWMSSLSQVATPTPAQRGIGAAVDLVEGRLVSDLPEATPEEVEASRRHRIALQHEIASLNLEIDDLNDRIDALTAIRNWSMDGQKLAGGRLIPADVISDDLLPWRSSHLLDAGSLHGVSRGAPVASSYFTIAMGAAEGIQSGMAILHREVLIGVVQDAGTRTSRVRLLSDVGTARKVRIAQNVDGVASEPLDPTFWLEGRGQGRMEIGNVDHRDVKAGLIQVGDYVLSDPFSGELPTAMVIGRITAIEDDHENALLRILTVTSPIADRDLHHVYIYDPA